MIEDDIFVTGNFGSQPKENTDNLRAFMDRYGKKWPLMCTEFWEGSAMGSPLNHLGPGCSLASGSLSDNHVNSAVKTSTCVHHPTPKKRPAKIGRASCRERV